MVALVLLSVIVVALVGIVIYMQVAAMRRDEAISKLSCNNTDSHQRDSTLRELHRTILALRGIVERNSRDIASLRADVNALTTIVRQMQAKKPEPKPEPKPNPELQPKPQPQPELKPAACDCKDLTVRGNAYVDGFIRIGNVVLRGVSPEALYICDRNGRNCRRFCCT